MRLKDLLEGVNYKIEEDIDINNFIIEDIIYNSKKSRENTLFVAIPGETVDGHEFVQDAFDKGTRVFILNKDVEINSKETIVKIFVEDSRIALSQLSANFFNHPSKELFIIGVTGTKGKTTVTNYLKDILSEDGKKIGIIGTNGVFYDDKIEKLDNTTPESYEINRILREMINSGINYVAMEVSSGGIAMHRVESIWFDIGIFTNISPDHIGPKEHPDFQHYLDSKLKLFNNCDIGIVNIDDEYGDYIIRNSNCVVKTFSIKKESDYRAKDIKLSKGIEYLGVKYKLKTKNNKENIVVGSPGYFSVYNSLSAIAISDILEIPLKRVKRVLKEIKVSGRVEVLPLLEDRTIILDYAHNKSSLNNVLDTLVKYNPNRLVCLIGSIGDRAQGRRKDIGEILSDKCDVAYITSDNPGFEDPNKIIEEIVEHIDNDIVIVKEPNRKRAVEKAIMNSQEGDIILLAGKGHERTQLIEGREISHSDRETAIRTVEKMNLN